MINRDRILELALNVLKEEAAAILQLCSRVDDTFLKACELLLGCEGRIIVTGIGKSGHIASKIAATFASTGSPAFFMHPSEASHGDIGVITKRDVVVALSKSGNTEEILTILPIIKLLGIGLIAITGNPNSMLAKAADVNLDVSVTKEACPLDLAPTASTTATLAMGDALAVALLESRGFTIKDFARSHPGGIIGKRLLLRVDGLMRTGSDIPIVNEDTPVSQTLLEMTEKRLGMTTVVDSNGALVGIFTDGDLRRIMDGNIDIHRTRIGSVMTSEGKTIAGDTLLVDAIKLMEQYQITSLVVVGEQQIPCGVIHIHDLLKSGLI